MSGSTTTFSNTGTIVPFTVPQTGIYDITAVGGHGGAAVEGGSGGFGASVGGDVTLTAGSVLDVLVGGSGNNSSNLDNNGGGGGGSFVVLTGTTPTPLVVAGGGGGAAGPYNGSNANATSTSGSQGNSAAFAGGAGGTGGAGGAGGYQGNTSGGGGGFRSNGGGRSGYGGSSFLAGGAGGKAAPGFYGNASFGGFGGGGYGYSGGGGGGGYSGGGGGGQAGGGGGGSFDSGTNQVTTVSTGTGNGSVVIKLLQATNTASTITGTTSHQATTDEKAIAPFSGVTITDPNSTSATDAITITLTNDQGQATDADGTLSGSGLTKSGTGTYTLAAAAPGTLTSELDALTFTPAPHQVAPGGPVTTIFTLADTNSAGLTTTNNTTSVIATAVNDPPTITGTKAGQTTTGTAPVSPFSGVAIKDPDVGVQDSLTITLTSGGTATDADGALSGAGLSKTGTGTYSLAAASPASLSAELDALVFTPAAGTPGTVTTTFTLAASQSQPVGGGTVTTTDTTTSVVDTAPAQPPTIAVPAADQARTSTGLATVTPFAGVSITDPNSGGPTETVTVTPSPTSIGTLADPNAATDHSTTNSGTGAITLTGSASAVSTDLDALTFTPAYGQSGKTTFTIADTNSAGQVATPGTAAVTVDLPTITPAQLQQVGGDLLQFYKDTAAHASTTADVSKLAGDVTALDLSQAELGSLLGQTLSWATLASAAASTLGNDLAATYYPKITTDLAHGGQGLASDLSTMLATTVGVAVDDLARLHGGQGASAALAATIQDYKLV